MGKITVTEEFQVSNGKVSIETKRKNGEFRNLYIRGNISGAIIYCSIDEMIELLKELKQEVEK